MQKLGTEMAKAQRSAVVNASLVLKKHVERVRDEDTGGDGRLSGVGSSGAKLGVGFDVKGTRNPTSLLSARGPWQLLNNPTKQHVIGAKKLGTRSALAGLIAGAGTRRAFGGTGRGLFGQARNTRFGKRALTTPDGPRAYAFHPGTAGKRTWQRGIDAGKPEAVQVLLNSHRDAAKRGMTG